METNKLIKVTFEYDNALHVLTGEEAEKWQNGINNMCEFACTQGMEYPYITWIVENKDGTN